MKKKARRLKAIADWINTNMASDGYEAKVVESFCNTDTKWKGSRLRKPGKGRHGNEIIIKKDGIVIKTHNSAETYRSNIEVEDWLERELTSKNNKTGNYSMNKINKNLLNTLDNILTPNGILNDLAFEYFFSKFGEDLAQVAEPDQDKDEDLWVEWDESTLKNQVFSYWHSDRPSELGSINSDYNDLAWILSYTASLSPEFEADVLEETKKISN